MPTTRPRYQVTETPEIERALDAAARRWPNEPRSKLLLRLVRAGGATVEQERSDEIARRRDAIASTSGKYDSVFHRDHLSSLRDDWPE
ncbi:MAG: hypothetical protein JST73_09720 [Actinobacteria bacterium]|nr:hypothetical protein [Actinomycetota bacterium]